MQEIKAYLPKNFLTRQGETLSEVLARLEPSTQSFQVLLDALDDKALQQAPEEGKWSPAEIADHLVLANELFSSTIQGACEGAEIHVMERGWLSDAGTPISPKAELPRSGRSRDALKTDLAQSLKDLIDSSKRAADLGLLDKPCVIQSFMGEMTVLEVMQLSSWHIRHHTRQLPNFVKS